MKFWFGISFGFWSLWSFCLLIRNLGLASTCRLYFSSYTFFPSCFSYSTCRSSQDSLSPCPCPFCHCEVYISYFPSWFAAVPFSDVQCRCIWRQNPVWKTETSWKKRSKTHICVIKFYHYSWTFLIFICIHRPSFSGFPSCEYAFRSLILVLFMIIYFSEGHLLFLKILRFIILSCKPSTSIFNSCSRSFLLSLDLEWMPLKWFYDALHERFYIKIN